MFQSSRSIFSLKNEPGGGSEAIRRQASFLGVGFSWVWFLEREDNKWESGKPAFGFPLFHA
jgi:hypothetical protein